MTKLLKNNYYRQSVIFIFMLLLFLNIVLPIPAAWAWDSESRINPTRPTHTLITQWAIAQLKTEAPELQQFQKEIIEGANAELHELPISGTKYGINLNAKRIEHQGTNEGCNDIKGWWLDSLNAYRQGNKEQAYFLLGVIIHMIEDMGVPAHANKVYHQGNLTEFDNFEFMALSNWKPNFSDINKQNPEFSEPWRYYTASQEWTHAEAPNYNNRNSFSKFWLSASPSEQMLLSNRQGRTCYVVMWALNSAAKAIKDYN